MAPCCIGSGAPNNTPRFSNREANTVSNIAPPENVSASSRRPRNSSPWLLVSVLLALYVISYLDRTIIAMLVDPIRHDLAITDTQMSLLIGLAFGLSYSFAAIPMGWLVDRYPRRWLIFASLSFWSLATAACGLAVTFSHMFAARVAVGLGEAPLHPASHSMISDTFPLNRLASAISVYSIGAVVGSGLSLIIGGYLIEFLQSAPSVVLPVVGRLSSWQLIFMAIGMPGLLLSLLVFCFTEPPRRGRYSDGQKTASWADLLKFMRKRWLVLTCFTIAFGGMQVVNGAFVWWQPAYLSRYFRMSPAQYGLALGLISVGAGVAGTLFSGWMVDRLYRRGCKDAHMRYYWWALIVSTPFVLIALLSTRVEIYFGLIWIAKLLMINFLGFSTAMIALITPSDLRGRMSALFTNLVLALSASTLGPLVPALISDHILHDEIRLGRALAITIVVFVPLALVALWTGRKALREAVTEAESWK